MGSQAGQGFRKFRIIEGEDLQVYLDSMDPKEVLGVEDGAPTAGAATAVAGEAAAPAAPATGDAPAAGGEAMETD